MSLFQTQADTYNNSFNNPLNPANVNAGWGIDSSLLTPSYMARYRPQYSGGQSFVEYNKTGFAKGISNLYGPRDYPYYANPIDHQQDDIDAVTQRPVDAAMWATQRIIAPALVFGGAFKAMGPGGSGMGFVRNTLAGRGFAAGAGNRFARGAAGGFARGMGFSAARAGAIASGSSYVGAAAGAVGGVIGGALLPIGAGMASMSLLEKGWFDPYIQQQDQTTNLMNNFRGINFSDASGNVVTGGGLGRRESAKMGNRLTKAGISDLMFSSEEFTQISDMTARSGLLDTVNSKGIVDKIKGVSEQIKLIMDITKDPDFQNAIEEIAKLEKAGASAAGGIRSDASQVMRKVSQFANMAGISAKRMMDTVGAQGEYLFQANGMTPYLGQMAAASAMASFSTAKRQGLMSNAQLARMGGVEGATQASLTGQINASQTLFNQMTMANTYMNGGRGGPGATVGSGTDMISTISQFSRNFVNKPLAQYGMMNLMSGEMASLQSKDRGHLSIDDQAYAYGKAMNLVGKDGIMDGANMPIILQQMGLSQEQIMAHMHQRVNDQNPETRKATLASLKRDEAERMRALMDQDAIHTGAISGPVAEVRKWSNAFTAKMSSAPGSLNSFKGALGDAEQRFADYWNYGGTISTAPRQSGIEDMFSSPERAARIQGQQNTSLNLIRTGAWTFASNSEGMWHTATDLKEGLSVGGWSTEDSRQTAMRINEMAKAGDKDAIAYLSAKTPEERSKSLSTILRKKEGTGLDSEFGSRLALSEDGFRNQKRFEKHVSNQEQYDGREKWSPDKVETTVGTEFEKALGEVRSAITGNKLSGTDFSTAATAETTTKYDGWVSIADRIKSGDINADNLEKELMKPENKHLLEQVRKKKVGDVIDNIETYADKERKYGRGKTDVGSYDTIKAAGEAQQLLALQADGSIKSEEDLIRLINTDPSFSETKRQYLDKNGRPTTDLAKQIRSNVNAAANAGIIGVASVAQHLKLDMASVENNPGLITDKTTREKFKNAKSYAEKQAILSEYSAAINGGSLDSARFKEAEDLSNADLSKLLSSSTSATGTRVDSYMQAAKNKIDYTDVRKQFEAMDNFGKGTTEFKEAVGEFTKAVDKLAGDKKGSLAPGDGVTQTDVPYWQRMLASMNPFSSPVNAQGNGLGK